MSLNLYLVKELFNGLLLHGYELVNSFDIVIRCIVSNYPNMFHHHYCLEYLVESREQNLLVGFVVAHRFWK